MVPLPDTSMSSRGYAHPNTISSTVRRTAWFCRHPAQQGHTRGTTWAHRREWVLPFLEHWEVLGSVSVLKGGGEETEVGTFLAAWRTVASSCFQRTVTQ